MNISSKILEPQEQSRDKGCEMAPCCLDCPFPACIQEEMGGGKRWLKDLSLEKEGEKVRLAGAVVRYQSPPVRGDGNTVVFLCLEDGTGVISVAVFRDVQEKSGAVLFREEWVVVEGTLGRRPLASLSSSAGLSITATALFPLRKYLDLTSRRSS